MNKELEAEIQLALSKVDDPFTGGSLTVASALQSIEFEGERLQIHLQKPYPLNASMRCLLQERIGMALRETSMSHTTLELELNSDIATVAVQKNLQPIKGIRNTIAIASGKGGVGKSTVSANIALALSQAGARVALLDADIYGPSQPRLFQKQGVKPEPLDDKMLLPVDGYGIKLMSIGFMVEEDAPMIWRGPMATQALNQLLRTTEWNYDGEDVDYMIIDLPPGTGDIQLTMAQKIPVSAAVIVTTPQDIALLDARKALKMFNKVGIDTIGVIENMSGHICSQCGHEEAVFGAGGGAQMQEEYGISLLGKIPLSMPVRLQSDSGEPIVRADSETEVSQRFQQIALQLTANLSMKKRNYTTKFPNIVVE